jgi:hypothetical protein
MNVNQAVAQTQVNKTQTENIYSQLKRIEESQQRMEYKIDVLTVENAQRATSRK